MLIVIAFADAITKICPCPLLPYTAFLSLWPPHKFSFRLLKYFDPTALPPRHGSYVLIRAPLLGVRTASDLCCRDLLTEVSRFLVHTLCYYYYTLCLLLLWLIAQCRSGSARCCGARAAFIRTHRPSTSSATAVFCSVAVPDVKNCRTSSYLAGRGALVVNARIVSSSSL